MLGGCAVREVRGSRAEESTDVEGCPRVGGQSHTGWKGCPCVGRAGMRFQILGGI